MIRTIFFDYDGVLTTDKSGLLTTFRYLSEASGIALSTINDAFNPHIGGLLLGRASHAEIWRHAMGGEMDMGLLARAFESTPLNRRMFSLAQKLKVNYSIGIITDNSKDRMDHLRKYQELDSLFSPIVVSAEVGGGKRENGIFLHAASCAGVAPDESIFIDNSEANLVVARAVGMHTVFHDDDRNDIGALMKELALLGAHVGDDMDIHPSGDGKDVLSGRMPASA
ncbi:HAD-IA family hydrolase [Dyella koreensis]|uniref:HAD-IA family hydrolase n=1 Tax=Dyella koreensis TaxID=311235 RepID=A0ABW8K5I2_9GAMM